MENQVKILGKHAICHGFVCQLGLVVNSDNVEQKAQKWLKSLWSETQLNRDMAWKILCKLRGLIAM